MPVYKQYRTRQKKHSRPLIVWMICILLAFGATVLLGAYLGKRAAELPEVTAAETTDPSSETADHIVQQTMRGVYFEPSALSGAVTAPEETASVWLYLDGKSMFASEFVRKLGQDVSALPALSGAVLPNTSGLFEVRSVTADAQIRETVRTYELSLLREYAQSGIGEIVLVFDSYADPAAVFDFAKDAGCSVICLPYTVLEDPSCARLFSEADGRGLSVALRTNGVSASRLDADVARYAFYFTRYNLRLILAGTETELLAVLESNALCNYQFSSALPVNDTAETEGAGE